MLRWALLFFIISIIAGAMGFTGVAVGFAAAARVLFFLAISLSVVFHFWRLVFRVGRLVCPTDEAARSRGRRTFPGNPCRIIEEPSMDSSTFIVKRKALRERMERERLELTSGGNGKKPSILGKV